MSIPFRGQSRYVAHGLLLLGSLLMFLPLVWMLLLSVTDDPSGSATLGELLRAPWSLQNYRDALGSDRFGLYLTNSVIISTVVALGSCLFSTVVAYAFARFEFWGRKLLFSVMIATMMLPLIVLRLPQYLVFREIGWLDSYLPLIVPSAFATDTFFVFMLVQFLRGIPRDMEEAAQIDGCNALQLLWHIIVPLLKPAIISVVVFQFIWTMNDFMGPLIYLASVEKYPVSLALKMSIGATEEVEWANVIAISVVALIPSVAVFFAAQKHFIEGATSSGVKG